MKLAIIGHAEDKFTSETRSCAWKLISSFAGGLEPEDLIISGGCHLGGVDIYAELAAIESRNQRWIFSPTVHQWSAPGGYKERNEKIANECDELLVVLVAEYPPHYTGKRFSGCYHCGTRRLSHVKSGACWTAKLAMTLRKPVTWIIIQPDGRYEESRYAPGDALTKTTHSR